MQWDSVHLSMPRLSSNKQSKQDSSFLICILIFSVSWMSHTVKSLGSIKKILVVKDISVLGFYEYIMIYQEISMDILTKKLMRQKLIRTHGNAWEKL